MPTDPYSFTDVTDRPNLGSSYAPVRAALSSADVKAAQLDIAQQRQDLSEEKFDTDTTLRTHAAALNQAKGYYDLAKNLTDMQEETASRLDAADFLNEFQHIDHSDPLYDSKINALQAKYPRASADKAVDNAIGVKNTARGTYVKSMENGGAYEFEQQSPAFNVFQSQFHQTGDPNQARAAAKAVQEGETQVRKAMEEGLLSDEDIYDDVQNGVVKPDLHDEAGNLHYHKLLNTAAKRKGEIAGKPAKAEDLQAQRDMDIITKLAPKVEDLKDSDPATLQIYRNAVKRRNAYDAKQTGTAEKQEVAPVSSYGSF